MRFPLDSLLACALLVGSSSAATAVTLTNLYSFNRTDGAFPLAGLVQGSDGDFYGTTGGGDPDGGYGTIFQITPAGTLATLHTFGQDFDGHYPSGALIEGSDCFFYGVTGTGGSNDLGTVFKISTACTFTTLYHFNDIDGDRPRGELLQSADGNFYGTTVKGGTNGIGTVFKITPQGALTTLHSFCGPDGFYSFAGVIQGRDGNLYGTTERGGTNGGWGTVFKITSMGELTTLYHFGKGADGGDPSAPLLQGGDGWFYGTTTIGGTNGEYGTVFRISSAGQLETLHDFNGIDDGDYPETALLRGSDGDFYGTTSSGGPGVYYGTAFKITSAGTFTTLWQFSGGTEDGGIIYGGLVQGIDGSFYGTTYTGGDYYAGCVYKLTVALNPPANQICGIRLTAGHALITIPSVSGETYQLQYRDSMTSGDWSNLPDSSVTNCIGGLLTLTNSVEALVPQRFYRINVTP